MSDLLWDPTDPTQRADPYPAYARLRDEAPVWRSPQGFWVLSRFADVQVAMSDKRFLSNDMSGETKVAPLGPDVVEPAGRVAAEFFSHWMTFSSDEADHRRLRRLYMTGFTPTLMEAYRPRLLMLVDELIAPLRNEESFDFIERFAVPLPVAAICDVLGVPSHLRPVLHALATPLARAFHAVPLTHVEMEHLEASITAFREAILRFLEDVRSDPGDSLIGRLVAMENEDVDVSEDELVAGIANLFFGGHHTSVHMLGNGLLALLDHPDQAEKLRSNPSLAPSAVEELLRFDSPAQTGAARYAAVDVELHGQTIPAGDKVLLLIGAANRDPREFEEPDVLDITREIPHPIVFGRGAHLCIGAPLARMEAAASFAAVLQAFPELRRVQPELERSEHSLFRGVERLVVANG